MNMSSTPGRMTTIAQPAARNFTTTF
jgi:hypothetical protein